MAVELVAEPDFDTVAFIARNMRDRDRAEIFATRWDTDPDAVARDTLRTGAFRWALLWNGLPVATLGAHPRWPGVWTAWAFATDDWPKVVRAATRHARDFMAPALFHAGVHRLDCLALETHKDARKWLTALGAVPENTLDNWGKNGESFVCYRWTRENTQKALERARSGRRT